MPRARPVRSSRQPIDGVNRLYHVTRISSILATVGQNLHCADHAHLDSNGRSTIIDAGIEAVTRPSACVGGLSCCHDSLSARSAPPACLQPAPPLPRLLLGRHNPRTAPAAG